MMVRRRRMMMMMMVMVMVMVMIMMMMVMMMMLVLIMVADVFLLVVHPIYGFQVGVRKKPMHLIWAHDGETYTFRE